MTKTVKTILGGGGTLKTIWKIFLKKISQEALLAASEEQNPPAHLQNPLTPGGIRQDLLLLLGGLYSYTLKVLGCENGITVYV